ncbi:uncharacterized protein LOC112904478 [Agrilus planipennis]|uniref:Uncharacterized protein LOC112904478 n=1 Tax=Agrilus planipennis TaxID=224129 RepID=A0A7F5R3T6_AGRPL|nr:uncharacterized protein LOC112904478 [Agrilus planipennis]
MGVNGVISRRAWNVETCFREHHGVEEAIDLYDILDENYMPGKLLLLENISKISGTNTTSIENPINFHYGSAEEAISTMGYHRKMMNEYLCRTYVSEKILSGMTLTRIKRKLGNDTDSLLESSSLTSTEKFLNDEGSTKYKEWLKRSATLQDIYRQFENPSQHGSQETQNRNDGGLGTYAGPLDYGHYEQSTVTPTVGSAAKVGYIGDGTYSYNGDHGSHAGYGYGPPAPYEDFTYEEQHHYAPKYYPKNKKKEELTQLFEIALTALAYLSFGMFLIHVLMCIMSAGSYANVTTMAAMPMSMGPTAGMMDGEGTFELTPTGTDGTGPGTGTGGDGTGTATGGGGTGDGTDGTGTDGGADGDEGGGDNGAGDDDGIDVNTGGDDNDDGTGTNDDDGGTENNDEDTEIITSEDGDGMRFRFKRNVNGFMKTSVLNEMARKVLITIDTALMAESDNGECLRRSLCENNKYSRGLNENGKYWIPVWSLGMSWLSGLLVKEIPRSTSMLESLKASLLGLGNSDCEFIYGNCNL